LTNISKNKNIDLKFNHDQKDTNNELEDKLSLGMNKSKLAQHQQQKNDQQLL